MKILSALPSSSLRTYVALDLRALALMRIAVGGIILVDLFWRLHHLVEHYGAHSVFPQALWASSAEAGYWSAHLLIGNPLWAGALMLLQGALAALLILGWRTQIIAALSWFFLTSLHHANPMIHIGSDTMLRVFLLIGIFLPLSARYSLDALRAPLPATNSYASLFTFAFIGQMALMYLSASSAKEGELWQSGEAVYYVLNRDYWRAELGDLLLHAPAVMTAITYAVPWTQLLGGFALLVSGRLPWLRGAAIAALMSMHIGFDLALRMGPFAFGALAGLIALMPSAVLDALERAAPSIPQRALEALRRIAPRPSALRLPPAPVAALLCGAYLSLIALAGFAPVGLDPHPSQTRLALERISVSFGINQWWALFAPDPPRHESWLIARGIYADGSELNLFPQPRPLSYDKPRDIGEPSYIPDIRVQKYMSNLVGIPSLAPSARYYADYVCFRERRASPALMRVELIVMREAITASGKSPAVREALYSGACLPTSASAN